MEIGLFLMLIGFIIVSILFTSSQRGGDPTTESTVANSATTTAGDNPDSSSTPTSTPTYDPVRFGDRVKLKLVSGGYAVYRDRKMEFGASEKAASVFFVRPVKFGPSNGDPVTSGTHIILSSSKDADDTITCGLYGCRVLSFKEGKFAWFDHGSKRDTLFVSATNGTMNYGESVSFDFNGRKVFVGQGQLRAGTDAKEPKEETSLFSFQKA